MFLITESKPRMHEMNSCGSNEYKLGAMGMVADPEHCVRNLLGRDVRSTDARKA